MILFLNKVDLFRDKIAKTDLAIAFPEYTGRFLIGNEGFFIGKMGFLL
jgi:hypothetical protein